MTKAWIISRDLTDDHANTLDIKTLTGEKDNNYFEALKIRSGFEKIGVDAKIVPMSELVDHHVVSRTPRDKLPDIAVVRCMMRSMKDVDTLNSLCNHGLTVMNNVRAQMLCNNKWLHYKELKKFNISIPKTTVVAVYSNKKEIDIAMSNSNLTFPIVVKSNCGSRSDSVFKCYNSDDVIECAEKIHDAYPYSKIMLLQEWIDHRSKGVISVLTLGGKVLAAQQRMANRDVDFFISNLRKDSNRCVYEITDGLRDISEAAVKAIGEIEMSRLDVLHDGEKYIICEVNSPGAFTSYDNFMEMDCGLMIAEYALERYKKDNKLI